MKTASDIVKGFMRAVAAGDPVAARRFLADDVSFEGPIEKLQGAESYLESLARLHHIIAGVDVKKIFVDGEDVCLLYDLVTRTPAGTAFIAEWHRVRDEKIVAIRVVFDARPFATVFPSG